MLTAAAGTTREMRTQEGGRDIMRHADILNKLDEIIYVVDMESYELLYLNRAARSLCAGERETLGRKCYKVLQGRDEPCHFCPVDNLRDDVFHCWEYANLKFGRHFLVRDKIVSWRGRKARLEVAVDVTRQQREKECLERRLNIKSTVMKCVRLLEQTSDDEPLTDLLALVADFYMADRAYLAACRPCGERVPQVREWHAPGVPSRGDELRRWCKEGHAAWREARERIVIAGPAGEEDFASVVSPPGVDAFMSVPVEWGDGRGSGARAAVGYLGVDNPRHAFGDTSLLESVAYVVRNWEERRLLRRYLEGLSFTDVLTGLGNRNRYTAALEAVRGAPGSDVGVAFVDINGLKALNDRFGHDYGDRLIVKVARILKTVFEDCVFRTGGDEFVVLCRDMSQMEFSARVERMLALFKAAPDCVVSCGSAWKGELQDVDRLVRYADELMYAEKQAFYKTRVGQRSLHHSSLLEETLLSLKKREFLVQLQPKVRLDSGRLVGVEALVRKRDAGGLIPPDRFIPLLESEFLIRHIDFFVLHTICSLLATWRRAGATLVPVSVNLSRITLMERGIVGKVADVCDCYRVPHSYIDLEITESVDKLSLESLTEISERFREEGFSISLDDFGARYCNMSILTRIRFNSVKIDKSIVDGICRNERARIVTKHSIEICNELENARAVAEGIETQGQLDVLRSLHCHYGQGYLFSPPLDIDVFEARYLSPSAFRVPLPTNSGS